MTEHDIYLDFYGCRCPCPQKKCSLLKFENVCGLEEPWFDCDEFQNAFFLDIANAENEIDSLELDDNWPDWDNNPDDEEDF